MNTVNGKGLQAVVVRQEKIGVCIGRTCEVDRVRGRNPVTCANPGVGVRGFGREGDQFNLGRAERLANLSGWLPPARRVYIVRSAPRRW